MAVVFVTSVFASIRELVAAAVRTSLVLSLLAPVAPVAQVAGQGPTVEQAGGSQEYGIDAGLTIGLGARSSVSISLPASRARVGFAASPNSRWSWEPAVGLTYLKVEGADGALFYDLEFGALYHFRATGDLAARGATVAYLRPFAGLIGVTGSGGDSEGTLGGGFGVKVPWRTDLAFRLEANTGYGIDNEAWRLGAFAGLSFFTR